MYFNSCGTFFSYKNSFLLAIKRMALKFKDRLSSKTLHVFEYC